MVQVLQECPEDILVMGNIDPVGIFKMATPEKVKKETLELLQKTGKWKNFIVSSGCDVPPEVPMENIDAFYQALNEYNRQ